MEYLIEIGKANLNQRSISCGRNVLHFLLDQKDLKEQDLKYFFSKINKELLNATRWNTLNPLMYYLLKYKAKKSIVNVFLESSCDLNKKHIHFSNILFFFAQHPSSEIVSMIPRVASLLSNLKSCFLDERIVKNKKYLLLDSLCNNPAIRNCPKPLTFLLKSRANPNGNYLSNPLYNYVSKISDYGCYPSILVPLLYYSADPFQKNILDSDCFSILKSASPNHLDRAPLVTQIFRDLSQRKSFWNQQIHCYLPSRFKKRIFAIFICNKNLKTLKIPKFLLFYIFGFVLDLSIKENQSYLKNTFINFF